MKIDGAWKAVEAQLGGERVLEEFLNGIFLIVSNDKYEAHIGNLNVQGTLKYFQYTVPMGMDMIGTEEPNKGKMIKAIYKSSGGYLFICYNVIGGDRPKTFASTEENQFYLVRYKRADQ